jgi:hypothetical protein
VIPENAGCREFKVTLEFQLLERPDRADRRDYHQPFQAPRAIPENAGCRGNQLPDLREFREARVTPENAAEPALKGLKANQLRGRADRKEFRASKVIRAFKAFRVNLLQAPADHKEFRASKVTPESEQWARPGYLLPEPPGLAESEVRAIPENAGCRECKGQAGFRLSEAPGLRGRHLRERQGVAERRGLRALKGLEFRGLRAIPGFKECKALAGCPQQFLDQKGIPEIRGCRAQVVCL